jgi:hypothetical protein
VERLLKEKEKQLSSRLKTFPDYKTSPDQMTDQMKESPDQTLKLEAYLKKTLDLKTLEDQMADLCKEHKVCIKKGSSASFDFQIDEKANLADLQKKRERLLRKLEIAETIFMILTRDSLSDNGKPSQIEIGRVLLSSISDQLDTNQDGSISKDEFEKAENMLLLSDFYTYDRDGDGKISKEEMEESEATATARLPNFKGDGEKIRCVLCLQCLYARTRRSLMLVSFR